MTPSGPTGPSVTMSPDAASSVTVELVVGGMTCASCAARIEKRLNGLDGVRASVNVATETATVTYDPSGRTPADLIGVVGATGYTARLPEPPSPAAPDGTDAGGTGADDGTDGLGQRLVVCALLSVPVVAMAMVPVLQFRFWQWLSLTLAAPVVVWGAWPFHRAAAVNARHRAATMDTLISVGVLAALSWSVWALFWGGAGEPGMGMAFHLLPSGDGAHPEIYLEVASGVTTFILLGRFFEARAKRRSGSAVRALVAFGVKDVAVLREGVEVRVPVEQLMVGDRFVVRPGEKVATDGVVEEGMSAIDVGLLTGESVPVEVGPGDEVAGATVNAAGRLVVRATRVGSDTALARIARLVTRAQSGKAPVQRLADRVSAVFVPVVIALSLVTLVGPNSAAWTRPRRTASSCSTHPGRPDHPGVHRARRPRPCLPGGHRRPDSAGMGLPGDMGARCHSENVVFRSPW